MELTIDLKKLKESGLFVEDFFALALINSGENPEEYLMNDPHSLRLLEDEMWIKSTEEGYELRSKGRELFESKATVTFEQFWEHYHTVTKLPKTDRAAAETKWKRLKPKEKEKAIEMVEAYYGSLNDKKYCRKARTYLENKNFNDEFKIVKDVTTIRINEMI
ncbi:MAG TPA: hypothetical protein PLG47_04335 [Candidatus Dojkabacteria bacterium]|nr:hypothetical protein [Candidatus Dojkabacteria bacterium]